MNVQSVRVWDPLVRIFHWTLVASFVIAWLTGDDWMTVHHWAGYAAAALVVFRIVWGFSGSTYARFGQFVRSPAVVLGFLRDMLKRKEPRYIGHNPAGGIMIIALIAAMLFTSVSGWMMTLDAYWGEEWIEEVHEVLANFMLGMVILHVAGVLWASYAHHENLVRSMIVGTKQVADREEDVR